MPCTEERSWYRWQVVAMLWAISFFNYADRQAIFSVFPLLQKQMGLTTIQLGLARQFVCVGVWVVRDVCWADCRSRAAENRNPRRTTGMERHLPVYGVRERFPRIVRDAGGGGFGRDLLLPGVDVTDQ